MDALQHHLRCRIWSTHKKEQVFFSQISLQWANLFMVTSAVEKRLGQHIYYETPLCIQWFYRFWDNTWQYLGQLFHFWFIFSHNKEKKWIQEWDTEGRFHCLCKMERKQIISNVNWILLLPRPINKLLSITTLEIISHT